MALATNQNELVLVTGAGGLLGSHLVKILLRQNYPVRALYHSTLPVSDHPSLENLQVDILDVVALEDAMIGVTYVCHCAGLVNFSAQFREKLYKINVEGTANVVNLALDAGIKKLVHVSSVAALVKLPEATVTDETMQWISGPQKSIYSHSKFLGEMEVWRGSIEGLNMVIINPSVILGAGDWETGSTKIFKSVYEEFSFYAEGINGFVGVNDVADIMIRLMQSDISGERFVVSADNISYRNLFNLIAKGFDKKPPTKKVNLFLATMVKNWQKLQSIFTGKPPFITKDTISTAMSKVYYDNAKLLMALPEFQYQPLPEVINEVCKDLKQKVNNQ